MTGFMEIAATPKGAHLPRAAVRRRGAALYTGLPACPQWPILLRWRLRGAVPELETEIPPASHRRRLRSGVQCVCLYPTKQGREFHACEIDRPCDRYVGDDGFGGGGTGAIELPMRQ